MKNRKLFCELGPLAYQISTLKCRLVRRLQDFFSHEKFACKKQAEPLPTLLYTHCSLMRRKLGNSQPQLQENKVVNLNLAAPRVSGILIRPGETFSFWKLVGSCSAHKGYKTGLIISRQQAAAGIGGGLCQFTNLLHWMVLHTPLDIIEHHHHEGLDLFPDYGRQVPFGTGTSILYNYLDYRFKNNTDQTYQLIVYTSETHLHGEIRAEQALPVRYHIYTEGEGFVREGDAIYRVGRVYRRCVDKRTGNTVATQLVKENHAKVLYDTTGLTLSPPVPKKAATCL